MESTAARDGGAVVGFVIPYFDDGQAWRRDVLRTTIRSIEQQTDDNWRAYLIDDCSPEPSTGEFLRELAAELPGRLVVLRTPENAGAGVARNTGIQAAHRDGVELLSYLDSDDQAHPDRVRVVREMFAADQELEFVYTDIEFVDEHDRLWESEELLPALHLLDQEQKLPKLRGRERWVEQAVERDNIAIPSAMNLRTSLAVRFPFPAVRFCEDVATLFRYLGSGAKIDHAPGIEMRYRVPRQGGSASRALSGDLEYFNRLRCVNERAGLEDAIASAVQRGVTDERHGRAVLCRYLLRIGRTVAGDGNERLGAEQIREAFRVDQETFAAHATAAERAQADGGAGTVAA
jgi:glycosyltransferase involved in cell wall biosynthesis